MIACPHCKSTKSWVVDKRSGAEREVRRRRQCDDCGRRYTTYESTYRPNQLRYVLKNPEAAKERLRRWREANPEKVQRIRQREAARKEAKETGRPARDVYAAWGCT